ncbi:HAD-IC family P-type ATPase [Synechococcus sp. CBW1108]|uniref:cation-translocating P-type ATPase n=1 Tax=Synechococcus sp. CBW1108 TaxID=1353147 RepID=UPI0018CDDFBD|nr:HAD-IC family P-type ATPase [Synechococcus sp. CBW1108]QPN71269.1 HAD-IC family P-type ATPase [Synechococcus sp. CBW1108]
MPPLPADVHSRAGSELAAELASSTSQGLSDQEAERRLGVWGPNALGNGGGSPAWRRFLGQFHDPLLYTLLTVGGIKLLLHEPGEALVIWSVTLINAVIGYVQESRAETAIAALARAVRTEVEVIRAGRRHRLASEQLVPGDLVRLEAGNKVPADMRLLQARNLQLDESSLTGESLPAAKDSAAVAKSTPLAERIGMAYAGSLVTSGLGLGLVVATGAATEVGQISSSLQQQVSLSTPLTRKFRRFSHTLLQLVLVLAGLTFLVGLLRGRDGVEMFDGAVALAVGAIPEELPAIVTITLAIGVNRMARRNAIIRKLPAVEALGSTTVICSDKTGTLTQNRMTVQEIYAGGALVPIEALWPGNGSDGDLLASNRALEETLLAGLLCSDARPSQQEGLVGDPTETALLQAAATAGLDRQQALERHPRRDAIPFESKQQYMATLHGSDRILVKGSVEVVLARCSRQLNPSGQAEPLEGERITAAVATMAGRGQRVLAFAIGQADGDPNQLKPSQIERGLDFLGLQGMLDPPRPEAIRAVAACQGAGIRVKMVTGDHLETARSIALQLGLGDGVGSLGAIDGRSLARLSPAELVDCVRHNDVFARVAPAQKLALVRALQADGAVVAMTGDGVNDAPALKQADIGIAMGKGGTEVAREAADMLLTDDNFATIEAAVEEGRAVYLNLHKALAFVLPVNGGASMTILLGAVLGLELPVTALQVLWLNMVCSLSLSIPLAFEPRPPGLMRQGPRPPAQPLLSWGLVRKVVLVSTFYWCFIFGVFLWARSHGHSLPLARTMAIQALVLAQIAYLVSISQVSKLGWRHWHHNPILLAGIGTAVVLQLGFSQLGWMNRFFATAPLEPQQWLICGVALLVMVPVAAMAERLDPTTGIPRD